MTKLLAVDDSNTMRKVLEITFAGEDFETLLASTPQEAVGHLRQHNPPIALVDITLSPSNGYEFCQQIKAEYPETRVLLLSSKQNPYDPARGAAVGADDHIDKPFDTQTLIDKVRALAQAAPKAVAAKPQPAAVGLRPRGVGVPGAASPEVAPRPRFGTASPAQPASRLGSPTRSASAPVAKPMAKPTAPAIPVAKATPQRSQPAALNGAGGMEAKLGELGLTPEQVAAVLALSREVIEQVVWEVVPSLAETLIKEEIARLTK